MRISDWSSDVSSSDLFHFAKTLAAELGLAAQRLLRDKAVRPDGARMDLVIDEMVQLQHVDVADSHLAIELLARAAIVKNDLSRTINAREFQHLDDVGLMRAVEDGRSNRHTGFEVACHLDELFVGKRSDRLVLAVDRLGDVLQVL